MKFYQFSQDIFNKHLLCPEFCSRCLGHIKAQDQDSCLSRFHSNDEREKNEKHNKQIDYALCYSVVSAMEKIKLKPSEKDEKI